MAWQYTPFIAPLILASALSSALAIFSWRRRPARGAAPFALVLLAIAEWSFGYAWQLAGADLFTKLIWAQIQYVGIVIIPGTFLVFALQYTEREAWLTRRTLVALTIEPVVTVLLAWTNQFHGLLWRTVNLDVSRSFAVLEVTFGPWYWVDTVYAYTLVLLSMGLLFRSLLRSPSFYRRQLGALLLGALAPLAGDVLYTTGLNPWPYLNLTPLTFAFTGLVISWGFFRFRLLDIVPTAHDAVIESMRDGVIVLDAQNRVVDLNPGAQRVLDCTTEEVIGKPATRLFADHPPLLEKTLGATSGQTELILGMGETRRYFDLSITPLYDQHDRFRGRVLMLHDVTERNRAEAALRESEERYALAVRGANDGIWDWNLQTNEIYFSPRWQSMLGYDEDQLGTNPDVWFERVHPDDVEPLQLAIAKHLDGLTSHFEHEYRILHRDGTYRWMLCRGLAVRNADGEADRMAGSQTEITERKRAQEQLIYDAFHDALTGLPNRALFMDRLSQALERSGGRTDTLFAVLFLDCDQFKAVNDSLGHTIGDKLLAAIARRLTICVRTADTVARLGGDEFAILAEQIHDRDDATTLADRIHAQLAVPFTLDGHEVNISASIGIVLSGVDYERAEDILRDADIAMYRAKALGARQHVVFESRMRDQVLSRLALESDLRHALERDELYLQYQPIVALPTGRITGFEALLRWHHPERGILQPSAFIPMAEESGLIVSIGEWVLHDACAQMRAWQHQFPEYVALTVSVNISRKQFAHTDLVQCVKQALQETELPASSLKLEITESVIMDDTESARMQVEELRALGVGVQLDDFGTGYSSLGYLHQFPIDTIKIDRTFIHEIEQNDNRREIVQAIFTLARDLDMNVVAEGVETESQVVQLQQLACYYVQGYYFSKPIDPEAVSTMLALISEATE